MVILNITNNDEYCNILMNNKVLVISNIAIIYIK